MADRVRGPRMQKQWSFIPGLSILFTVGATKSGAALTFGEPATVLRMIGEYTISLAAAPTALDSLVIAVAIGVVSTDAFNVAAAAALPDPSAEPDYPWLYWTSHPFFFPTTSTDPNGDSTKLRLHFDIKSMRKMKSRESLVMVAEYANLAGSQPDITMVVGGTRVLLAT